MPSEIKDQKAILNAVRKLEVTSELLEEKNGKQKYGGDLEVIVSGRDYSNGKKVGPYARLLVYESGEEIMRQGDWGGNTFYIAVEGALDVYVKDDDDGAQKKIDQLQPGACFGEMSVLAGVARNATIKVPSNGKATVLEITRPALRLLRKLPKFAQIFDATYHRHGLKRTLEDLGQAAGEDLPFELLNKLGQIARFIAYGKNHSLFQEGEPIDKVLFIKSGWVRRVRGLAFEATVNSIAMGVGSKAGVDFLGPGNCLGLEAIGGESKWQYSAAVMSRAEVLEIPIMELRADRELCDRVLHTFSDFSLVDDASHPQSASEQRSLAAVEEEITTGIVDSENLLVMDMDLCVRCGNCSLACQKVHGRSRLLRRGIHIERPVKLGSKSTQHVLTPRVCIHCQDPECLAGCPTGAIARFTDGHIDINQETCIGCFDCATQCPYDAITMVPRDDVSPQTPFSVVGSIRKLLSLAPQPSPAPVEDTGEMVAIKCNLCENTAMNPEGSRRAAYSCEENCPTGALVRVNPRLYFSEVKGALGLVYRDQTHAIGRNIHQRDPFARLCHVFGVLTTIALTGVVIWGLLRYGYNRPVGGTGLTMYWVTGIGGLTGIIGAMAYQARKKIYRRRAGALRYWMLAHIYFGVIASVFLSFHSANRLGGLLTISLTISYALVLASGLFGIICYLIVPRIMTSIEGDPLLIEDLLMRRDELRETIKTISAKGNDQLRELIEGKVRGRFLSLSYLMLQYLRRVELTVLLAHARAKFKAEADLFDDQELSHLLIEAIEATATLRRVDSLVYLHRLLKVWLAPHIISTALMLALMFIHVIQVTFFSRG